MPRDPDEQPRPARPLPARLDPRAGRPARPAGAAAGSAAADTAAADAAPTRSRTGRRLAVGGRAVAALLSLLLLSGGGWGWYLGRVAEASVNRTDAIPTSGNEGDTAVENPGEAMNLLLVGLDSRAGLTPEQVEEYSTGDPDGLHNTDTMMLVHIPADGSAASFVSFPRDMYVPIPGYGHDKLNSAYGYGYNAADGDDAAKDSAGAQLLIQTISQLSGLRIDHFAEINLLGFINLTSIVGGVQVDLCQASDDPVTGAHFDAGPQTLSGSQALLFVRQRHGVGPRSSDFDRVARQQVFIAGMLRNLLSSNLLLDLPTQRQIVEQVGSSVTLDQGLDVFDLAAQLQSVQLGNISFQTVPGLTDGKDANDSDVLELPGEDVLASFFSTLTADPVAATATTTDPTAAAPATVAPSSVTVSVLNGSGVSGAASSAAATLAQSGFQASSGGNATATATTTIGYATGDDATAAALAAQVPGATLTADDTLPAGSLTLTLGSDFTGIGQPITVATPAEVPGAYVNPERTADDTSCIN